MQLHRLSDRCRKFLPLIFWSLIFALLSGCGMARKPLDPKVLEMAKAGKAYFEEKCKTVAGEKIYRIVPDVEGILLVKVRSRASESEWMDPDWSGAGFIREHPGDDYIRTFLGYEYSGNPSRQITSTQRGYIAPDKRSGGRPGYRFVDVIDVKDGKQYRYFQVQKEVEHIRSHDFVKFKSIDYVLERKIADQPLPRYGVTYEDYVIAEERSIGFASGVIKVIDLINGETLGEMVRYVYRPRGIKVTNWQHSTSCPGHYVGSGAATRKFVDQVLIPKGD